MTYPSLRLISHKLCPFVQRARIVLAERDIPHELLFIDLADRPDWFFEISPTGNVPVLCVEGKPLFESTAIIEFLNDISGGTLHPDDAYERARNRAWVELASAAQMTIGALRTWAPQACGLWRGSVHGYSGLDTGTHAVWLTASAA